jgi:hypothetical protein
VVFGACTSEKEPNFFVFNDDYRSIDSLQIFIGQETFLLENIPSKKTKSLHIESNIGPNIVLKIDTLSPLYIKTGSLLPEDFSGTTSTAFRGVIKVSVRKNKIISFSQFNSL